MNRIFKEPLLHFILIGLGIFLLYGFLNGKTQQKDEIVINDSDLNHMVSIWKMQWQRDPTEDEIAGLVKQYIKQEVLYREALSMNLDANDEIIKRRMAQKMEFLSNDVNALLNTPDEQELQKYYNEHSERYMTPFRYTFYQIIFTFDNNKSAEEAAKQAINKIQDELPNHITVKGDRSPFPFLFENTDATRIDADLGRELSASLSNAQLNKWQGPFSSGFGMHLVYITNRIDPMKPERNEIKELILRDYEFDKERESRERIYNSLMEKYKVTLELSITSEKAIAKIKEQIAN